MPLSKAAVLQGVVALGIAIGAVVAARYIPLRGSLRVLPVGVAMGLMVPVMTVVNQVEFAYVLMVLIGALAGFFVVPMNALLQHRGHVLMSAGHSIAVQNFNENLNILLMLGLYAVLIRAERPHQRRDRAVRRLRRADDAGRDPAARREPAQVRLGGADRPARAPLREPEPARRRHRRWAGTAPAHCRRYGQCWPSARAVSPGPSSSAAVSGCAASTAAASSAAASNTSRARHRSTHARTCPTGCAADTPGGR